MVRRSQQVRIFGISPKGDAKILDNLGISELPVRFSLPTPLNIFLVVYVFDNTPCSKQVCPRSARTAPHILYRSQHMLLCAFLLAGCQIFFLCALFVCTFFLTFSLVPIMLCALFNVMYSYVKLCKKLINKKYKKKKKNCKTQIRYATFL